MVQVSYSGCVIEIDGNEVEFEYPIKKSVVLDDLVVVLLDPPVNEDVRDNVVCLTPTGEQKWTIEPPTTEDVQGEVVYVDIQAAEGDLIANTWEGMAYSVDRDSGKIEVRGWGK